VALSGYGRLHGSCAEQWVVSARLVEPPGALSLFLVDRDAQGVTLTVDRDIADRPLAKVRFEGVMIPATQRLGTSDAAPLIDAVLDRAALAACSESLGALNAAFRATVRYVNGRKQFGRTLGSFQVLRHRLVDMRIAEIEARAVIGAATEAVDQGTPNQREMISSAKVITDRAAKFVCENSIQLHGGMGMTDDLDVGHYYKRVLSIASQFGDVDWHLDRIAARIGRDDDPRVTPPGHEECPR
jgi:alkylation response protein AidB-like acyl-CoA dehydrogenase